MANPESRMTVTFTKKYIKIKALEAEMMAAQASLEYLKAQGAEARFFEENASRMVWIAGQIEGMVEADEDGNLLRATCPKCGQKFHDPMGKNAMIYHCHCGNEFKIDKLPGGLDLTPDLVAMFNENHGGGDNAGREQANDPTT
jgi:hypothetical protein